MGFKYILFERKIGEPYWDNVSSLSSKRKHIVEEVKEMMLMDVCCDDENTEYKLVEVLWEGSE